MFNEPSIEYNNKQQNTATIRIIIPNADEILNGKPIENIKNCDIFIEENNFLIYVDVKLYRLYSPRKFNIADLKQFEITYDTKNRMLELQLPCEAASNTADIVSENAAQDKLATKFWRLEHDLDLWKLKRITTCCRIRIDSDTECQECDADFCYGFAGKFKGKICSEDNLNDICRMTEPFINSPLQRTIDREIDELKDFDRDQYKLNFIDLQVEVGHDNPLVFNINWKKDCPLTQSEECLLHNLTLKSTSVLIPEKYSQSELDCGLVSILLAVCYDVRTTSNDPTCESGWTRSILTPTLYYFEEFTKIRDVVIAFLRRCLIYPLYRNYDLGRLCVEDIIDALHQSPQWIKKQLLVTRELFANGYTKRDIFNHYYIDDYISYVCNDNFCPASHLQILANNLKNVLYDISKKHLRLGLADIESEVLIGSLHINAITTSEEEDTDGTESDEYETETSSASETDENSVIEQCIEIFKP